MQAACTGPFPPTEAPGSPVLRWRGSTAGVRGSDEVTSSRHFLSWPQLPQVINKGVVERISKDRSCFVRYGNRIAL